MKHIEIRCDFCNRQINNYYSFKFRSILRRLVSVIFARVSVRFNDKWENEKYKDLDMCTSCYAIVRGILLDNNRIDELRDVCTHNATRRRPELRQRLERRPEEEAYPEPTAELQIETGRAAGYGTTVR